MSRGAKLYKQVFDELSLSGFLESVNPKFFSYLDDPNETKDSRFREMVLTFRQCEMRLKTKEEKAMFYKKAQYAQELAMIRLIDLMEKDLKVKMKTEEMDTLATVLQFPKTLQ